ITASIKSLEEHLLFGSLLASLVVLLFIRDLRSVIIAAIAIPTSIIATFTVLKAMDFTLNNMTLLALTLSVGIVIDDAIVVLENIVRYIEEKSYPPIQAAIEATREIALAVLATTISLVVIFLPIAFMTGYARRYVNQFGWTIAFSVMVSILVSFPLNGMVGRDWIPPDDQSELNISLYLPEGISMAANARITRELGDRVVKLAGVEFVNPYVHGGTMGGGSNHSHIYVKLTDV